MDVAAQVLAPPYDIVTRKQARALAVSVLHDEIIAPILKITDVRNDPRIDFVGGHDSMSIMEAKIDNDVAKIAFAIAPTRMAEIIAVADRSEVMPPKSTWFEPKLEDGLISYDFS